MTEYLSIEDLVTMWLPRPWHEPDTWYLLAGGR